MKLGIIIYSNDPESVWNAFRLGNYAIKEGDEVKAFLSGKGVESESIDTEAFNVTGQMRSFIDGGGAHISLWHLSQNSPIRRFGNVSTVNACGFIVHCKGERQDRYLLNRPGLLEYGSKLRQMPQLERFGEWFFCRN